MRLSAYDLSSDKAAVLAAFVKRHKAVQAPVPEQTPAKAKPTPAPVKPAPKPAPVKAEAKPKPKKKPVPKPVVIPKPARVVSDSSHAACRERASLIYDMQKKGMARSEILEATSMTLHAYKSALRAGRKTGIIPDDFVIGQRKKIRVTKRVESDLKTMIRSDFCRKYGCSVKTVSLMRKRLGIDKVVFAHKWYAEDIARLFEYRAAGMSYRQIGDIYGITGASVSETVRKAVRRGLECYPNRPKKL